MDTVIRASSFENRNKKILIPFKTSQKIKNLLIKKGFNIFTVFDENIDIKTETKKFGLMYYLHKEKVKKA